MSQDQYITVEACNNQFWYSPSAEILRMALHNLIRARDGKPPFTGHIELNAFKARVICGVLPEDWDQVASSLLGSGMVGSAFRDGDSLVLDVLPAAVDYFWNPEMQQRLEAFEWRKEQAAKLDQYHSDRGTAPPAQPLRIRLSAKTRALVLNRDGHTCKHCGTTEHLAVDHIIPVVLGGGNEITNLQVLCRSCNTRKGTSL